MTVSRYQLEQPFFRHELKYLCSEADLALMECRLRCICKKDPNAGDLGAYRIRSMYFDTPEDKCVRENRDGYNDRAKYRIRIYNASDQVIKLEKKYMVRGMKAKQACNISREQCERLLCGQEVGECLADQALLRQFLCERAAEGLAPKVIVEYVRTPYVYGIGNLRITFDRNITSISAGCSDFFARILPGRAILEPGRHILEVKYDTMIPASIVDCINTGILLCRTSFSKYTLCRQYAA